MTLDMAWPEYRVAVEYDGDHHRTSQTQWRTDQEKRVRLGNVDWDISVANGATLASAASRSDFAFPLARRLTLRGAEFTFHVVAKPLEEIVRDHRSMVIGPQRDK